MTNQSINIINSISSAIELLKIDIMIANKEKIDIANIPIFDEEYRKLDEAMNLLKEIDKRTSALISNKSKVTE